MDALITVLEGDGIGPEVAAAGRAVLARIGERHGHRFEFSDQLIDSLGKAVMESLRKNGLLP